LVRLTAVTMRVSCDTESETREDAGAARDLNRVAIVAPKDHITH
jgi:hypothetical protein